MKISVYDELCGNEEFTVDGLSASAPLHLSLQDRVPGVEGKAFDVKAWYRTWRQRQAGVDREPTHMTVEADDEFQAVIPWEQLGQAVFLYGQKNGEPLQKGFPIRLYVPDGSSECLNVKSVVKIRFGYEGAAEEATYGFKNRVSMDELRLKK